MEYQLIRSRRRTLEISVDRAGRVRVRAPMRLSQKKIQEFLDRKADWIHKKQEEMKRRPALPVYSPETIEAMKKETLCRVLPRVDHFSKLIGVTPTSIKVTSAQKRWGSCSGKNGLCFSFMLAEKPDDFLDSVVIHELCHIVHHNHSPQFWQLVRRYDPSMCKQKGGEINE